MGLEQSKLRRAAPEPEQEDQVEPAPPSDVSHILATGADEQPLSSSLSAHRERVQQLRAQQASEPSTDAQVRDCLLYTSPSPRDGLLSRMPSSA